MPITVSVSRDALMNLGRAPSGPVHLHWLKLMALIDRKAKQKLSNDVVHVRTGNLRSSQQAPTVEVRGNQLVGAAVNIAKYAAMVHDGTRAHPIHATRVGFLTGWSYQGAPVFVRSVSHPGTKARPWLLDSLREAMSEHV